MAVPMATRVKANLLKAVIDQVTGGECVLQDRENSIKIILTEQQKKWFQRFLDTQLEMAKKPDIEIDALGIIAPVVLKRVWPFLAAGGGIMAAFLLKGRDE